MTNFDKLVKVLWEAIKIVAITLIIIIPIRLWIMQPFFVSGASMEPSFDNGDYLIIDELTYHFEQPSRGDVIVFKYPEDPSQYYIKRIIGLPGETVEIQDGQVYIYNKDNANGFLLEQSSYGIQGFTFGNMKTTLDNNQYFVMGDNRSLSSDSRRWGPVNRNLIIGKVLLRALPVNKFQAYTNG
jgi:signal peptidase I